MKKGLKALCSVMCAVFAAALVGCGDEPKPQKAAELTDEELLTVVNRTIAYDDYTTNVYISSSVARIYIEKLSRTVYYHDVEEDKDTQMDYVQFNKLEYDIIRVQHRWYEGGSRDVRIYYYKYEDVLSSTPGDRILVLKRYAGEDIKNLSFKLTRDIKTTA